MRVSWVQVEPRKTRPAKMNMLHGPASAARFRGCGSESGAPGCSCDACSSNGNELLVLKGIQSCYRPHQRITWCQETKVHVRELQL